MKGQIRLRVYITEREKVGHTPLYRELLTLFHKEKVAGCTVLRGVAGYGRKGYDHDEAILLLGENLPLVVEVVDDPSKLKALLPKLKEMAQGAFITWEEVSTLER